jgi:hypothetical protein
MTDHGLFHSYYSANPDRRIFGGEFAGPEWLLSSPKKEQKHQVINSAHVLM